MKRRRVPIVRVLAALVLLPFLLSFVSCRQDLSSVSYRISGASCQSFFVYRFGTEEYESAGEEILVRPASLTKLLTALTALDVLSPETEITPGDEVYRIPEDSTIAYVRPHHTLTLEMLIEGMLLPSGGDAAYAVASACGTVLAPVDGQDPVARFVTAMNEKASSLGCTGSVFTVPDGYDEVGTVSTVPDMCRIARAAAENELICRYAALSSDDVTYASGHVNTWKNTNRMLDRDSAWYDPSVKGLKTGSLSGNYSLILIVEKDSGRWLVGLFGSDTDDGRYRDAAALLSQIP